MLTAAEIPIHPQPMLTVDSYDGDENVCLYILIRLQEYLPYNITESFLVVCFLKVPSGSLQTIRWYVIFTKLASAS